MIERNLTYKSKMNERKRVRELSPTGTRFIVLSLNCILDVECICNSP